MIDRSTPNVINHLNENEIMVFGSCLNGQHRFGEAKVAMQFGAEINKSVGLVGQTYAIPIRHRNQNLLLSIDEIKKHIDDLMKFVRRKHNLLFLITEIGCEKGEYGHKNMAPLFKDFINTDNVFLPIQWLKILNDK